MYRSGFDLERKRVSWPVSRSNGDDFMQVELFNHHIEEKYHLFRQILEDTGWEHLLISSGSELVQFRDDMHYPFKVNPYFKEWVPLIRRPNCFLLISEDEPKPKLFLKQVSDYWHSAPESLPEAWCSAMEVRQFADTKDLFCQLPKDIRRLAYLGPKMTAMSGIGENVRNPQSLLNRIDYLRGKKTFYEQACIREANKVAVRGHRAAERSFRAGKAELGILLDYLDAVNCSDQDLPYGAIVALNEHAAVLHHNHLQRERQATNRSFLIDAGATYNGYASDITRTYAADENQPFAGIIAALDDAQREIVAAIKPGISYVDLHREADRKIAGILKEFGVLKTDVDTALEQRLTAPFFPHGLGHFLGVQVHDKGGHQATPEGGDNPPPSQYPHLRLTRGIEVGQVFTIEPGIYFIPSLLEPLRQGEHAAAINWQRVEQFTPYGGVRIEDNVLVKDNGVENFTRDAFSASR